jgi:hypothetical protein
MAAYNCSSNRISGDHRAYHDNQMSQFTVSGARGNVEQNGGTRDASEAASPIARDRTVDIAMRDVCRVL